MFNSQRHNVLHFTAMFSQDVTKKCDDVFNTTEQENCDSARNIQKIPKSTRRFPPVGACIIAQYRVPAAGVSGSPSFIGHRPQGQGTAVTCATSSRKLLFSSEISFYSVKRLFAKVKLYKEEQRMMGG